MRPEHGVSGSFFFARVCAELITRVLECRIKSKTNQSAPTFRSEMFRHGTDRITELRRRTSEFLRNRFFFSSEPFSY